jgi:hypothetical protein
MALSHRLDHNLIHELTLARTTWKFQIIVMPASKFTQMPPDTSMSAWIPALHAGMTH